MGNKPLAQAGDETWQLDQRAHSIVRRRLWCFKHRGFSGGRSCRPKGESQSSRGCGQKITGHENKLQLTRGQIATFQPFDVVEHRCVSCMTKCMPKYDGARRSRPCQVYGWPLPVPMLMMNVGVVRVIVCNPHVCVPKIGRASCRERVCEYV